MKIVSAIDSFKGSLSSKEINECVEQGIKKVYRNCNVIKVPIADGGEGTVEAIISSVGGNIVNVMVLDPLGREITAHYGILKDNKTAVIESALASGLPLLTLEERNPMKTSSYGTGELIRDALKRGCNNFIIGIGGSATNDSGTGMLEALGYEFYDEYNNYLSGCGENLEKIKKIKETSFVEKFKHTKFTIACDVDNPLYGERGAAFFYAKQKGADDDMIIKLDNGLRNFAEIVLAEKGINLQNIVGSGAAGGIGGAFAGLLGAELKSGIDIILDTINFKEIIKDANYVFTGEGKMDFQSVMGKTPIGVAKYAKEFNIPVIALAGGLGKGVEEVHKYGIDSYFSIINYPITLENAMKKEKTKDFIKTNTEQICRLIKIISLCNKKSE